MKTALRAYTPSGPGYKNAKKTRHTKVEYLQLTYSLFTFTSYFPKISHEGEGEGKVKSEE